MKDRENKDLVESYPVIDAIWEPGNRRLSNVVECHQEQKRPFTDLVQKLLQSRSESSTQAGPLQAVPIRRVVILDTSSSEEDQWRSHCWNRESASALIVSQGITSSG